MASLSVSNVRNRVYYRRMVKVALQMTTVKTDVYKSAIIRLRIPVPVVLWLVCLHLDACVLRMV